MTDELRPDHAYFQGFPRALLAWPDDRMGPFVIEAYWGQERGRPTCVGLSIWKGVVPDAPGDYSYRRIARSGPLDEFGASDLRSIPVATVIERLWTMQVEAVKRQHESLAVVAEAYPDSEIASSFAAIVAETPAFTGDGPRRRQADDVEHFSAVAAVYRAAMDVAGRKRPTEAVRSHFSVSHSTATKWVQRARQMGLLPPTTPGKPAKADTPTKRSRKGNG